jgi:hypothetical protein
VGGGEGVCVRDWEGELFVGGRVRKPLVGGGVVVLEWEGLVW